MTPLAQLLYLIAITVAPAGTHHITVSAASESYSWSIDGKDVGYASSQLKPYGTPEHTLVSNRIAPADSDSSSDVTAKISAHRWDLNPVLKFDDSHQLEKDPGGYVYAVRIGSNSQKLYSITFCP